MTFRALAATAAVFASLASPSLAEFRVLDRTALLEAVSGKTVTLETDVGTIPISFKSDGTMIGRTQTMANWLGRSFDQGTWWIENDKLCQKWKLWLDGRSYCFTIRQNGQKVQWTRNDGLKGTLVVSN
jgi:hypothetical protein